VLRFTRRSTKLKLSQSLKSSFIHLHLKAALRSRNGWYY